MDVSPPQKAHFFLAPRRRRVRSWSTSRTTSCASPATSSRGTEMYRDRLGVGKGMLLTMADMGMSQNPGT